MFIRVSLLHSAIYYLAITGNALVYWLFVSKTLIFKLLWAC